MALGAPCCIASRKISGVSQQNPVIKVPMEGTEVVLKNKLSFYSRKNFTTKANTEII